jgi:hypothetical protein
MGHCFPVQFCPYLDAGGTGAEGVCDGAGTTEVGFVTHSGTGGLTISLPSTLIPGGVTCLMGNSLSFGGFTGKSGIAQTLAGAGLGAPEADWFAKAEGCAICPQEVPNARRMMHTTFTITADYHL